MPNIKLALRTLAKAPFVTAVAIGSLALGIGANTAIFSMFQRILRQPLSVDSPGQLVNLAAPGPSPGSTSCNQAGDCSEILSYPMFRDLERGQSVLAGLVGHRSVGTNLSIRGHVHDSEAMLVSGGYFGVLGLRPALGRLLGPSDDEAIGGHFVAVLGYRYWDTQLGRDPTVLGETIVVNGAALTVVGVAPPSFDGTTLGIRPSVFVPINMRAALSAGSTESFDNRRDYWVYAFGRLQPGASIARAQDGLRS